MLSKQSEEWLLTGMVSSLPFACPNMLESYACNFADCFQVPKCHVQVRSLPTLLGRISLTVSQNLSWHRGRCQPQIPPPHPAEL